MKISMSVLLVTLVFSLAGCNGKKSNENRGSQPSDKLMESIMVPEVSIDHFLEAALNGDLAMVRGALDNGMAVDSSEEDARTALMLASYNGHLTTVSYLLSKGADPNLRDEVSRTALMYASTGPYVETVELLLEAKALINVADSVEHFTALMFAAAEGQKEVIVALLREGADMTMKDIDGDTAYDFAKNNGHTAVLDLLAF